MLKASVHCSMDTNFFLDGVVELTASVRILKVKSSTSSSCKVDRSMNSPDQLFSFFFKDTVACNDTREEMNCWLLFNISSALSDNDVEEVRSVTVLSALFGSEPFK